jgi:hypothetical protein
MRWFLNLRAGLDLINVPYRLNDYRSLKRTPSAVAYVVGKPHVINKIPAGHPIAYGPGVAAHPLENEFWDWAEIELMLISCQWFKKMYDRDLPRAIPTEVWPAGVDTNLWRPLVTASGHRVLVYDKVRWRRDEYVPKLIDPLVASLRHRGLDVVVLRYGYYLEEDYQKILQNVSCMLFLCEHETQGFAYLQALSSNVPVLAWDRGGMWQDPSMYPDRVRFEPVTSVPYFDERCGMLFSDFEEYTQVADEFFSAVDRGCFRPREYILENFNLADRAREFIRLTQHLVKSA